MPELLAIAVTILAVMLALGLVALLRARGTAEQMLAAQLLATGGLGLLLLLGLALDLPPFVDVALILGLLVAIAVVAFTRRPLEKEHA